MGYIRHDAILVTCVSERPAAFAHSMALSLDLPATPMIQSPVNGYISFLVAPDGSKEGWRESDNFDTKREQFIQWMRDSDWCYDFVAVNYGGDEPEHTHLKAYNGQSDFARAAARAVAANKHTAKRKTTKKKVAKQEPKKRRRVMNFAEKEEKPEEVTEESANLCEGCGKVPGTQELHECPYRVDIHDDSSPCCNCCPDCEHECCMDI